MFTWTPASLGRRRPPGPARRTTNPTLADHSPLSPRYDRSTTVEQNILVLGFDEDSKAYQAFSLLKQAAAQGRVELHEGVIIERDATGGLHVREEVSAAALPGTAMGGLLGALVGLLGGPLGVLLGGTTGLLFGSAADYDRAVYEQTLVAQMAEMIPAGTTGVIALVTELAEEVVDAAMRPLDAVVLRSPASDVQMEVSAQAEAARAAELAARKILRAQHAEARRAKFDSWGAAQRKRLRSFGERIRLALARDAS